MPKNNSGFLEEAGYATPLPDSCALPQVVTPLGKGYFGAYVPSGAWAPRRVEQLETGIGRDLDIVQWFTS